MGEGIEFGIICLCLLVIVIGAFVVYYKRHQKMVDTIEQLTNRAEEIAEGTYDEVIVPEGTSETIHLAKALNKMTKRLRIERERVESRKEQLNSILSSMNSGVMVIESSGRILFYNQHFLSLFYNQMRTYGEDLLHKSFYMHFKSDVLSDIIYQVEEAEKPVRKEFVLEDEFDTMYLVVKGTPLYKNSKKKYGTILVAEDITRMKKLETIRKDFVSNVTHELKTPLTSIRGFVDTLKDGAIEDPVFSKRFLDIIDIETERLSVLVNDILILSEIENAVETGKSMVRVEAVIDEVIELLQKKKKDSVNLIKEMESPVTDFLCNRDRLKELILNLADNGVKYTNEGTVTIKCWEDEHDLILQFKDTGVGIPEEHLPRLFERFYRVDKGRSRKLGGTGLGLSIVKHITELYKGTIRVESKVGEGTVFTVILPYYDNRNARL